jgi:hypothetical protein
MAPLSLIPCEGAFRPGQHGQGRPFLQSIARIGGRLRRPGGRGRRADRTGPRRDPIVIDLGQRQLDLAIDEDELTRRRDAWTPRPSTVTRGYLSFYAQHVASANKGAVMPR